VVTLHKQVLERLPTLRFYNDKPIESDKDAKEEHRDSHPPELPESPHALYSNPNEEHGSEE
jgi:hypothetical protein